MMPVFNSLTHFLKGHIAHAHARNHVKRERGCTLNLLLQSCSATSISC